MEPPSEALISRKDHEGKRTSRNIRFRQKSGDVPDPCLHRVVVLHTCRRPPGMLDAFEEPVYAAPSDGDGLDHFYAEHPRQLFLIYHDAAALGLIIHVEIKDKRYAHLGKLQRDEETATQVLGIGHLDDHARPVREQHIPRDLFILGHRDQAVHARRIYDQCARFIQYGISITYFYR